MMENLLKCNHERLKRYGTLRQTVSQLVVTLLFKSYLCKKNCSVYIQCKGDIVVVDIKQHKSQFLKFKLYHYTVSKVLLTLCNGDV